MKKAESRVWLLGVASALQLLVGCNSADVVTQASPRTGLEIKTTGPIQFGDVLIGNALEASLILINHDAKPIVVMDSFISPPFTISKILPFNCSPNLIPALSTCIATVRFSPVTRGTYQGIFAYGPELQTLSGRGVTLGILGLSVVGIDLDTNVAGSVQLRTIQLTNSGDTVLTQPTLTLPTGISLGDSYCKETLLPGGSCSMTLKFQKTVAGVFADIVLFRNQEALTSLPVTGRVEPEAPFGGIPFQQHPFSIPADGRSTQTLTIGPVQDRFGNSVADGTAIKLYLNNANASSVDLTTVNGLAQVMITSTTSPGAGNVSVVAGSAYGTLNFNLSTPAP